MCRILIGVCARQRPEIFHAFLESLFRLAADGLEVHYLFIFHNWEQGKPILSRLAPPGIEVHVRSYCSPHPYVTDGRGHVWTRDLIRDVAEMKNTILKHALDKRYDAVFLVDSDIILQPPTLKQLWNSRKDVISEVFWTRWDPDGPELPNAWDFDQYGIAPESLRRWRRPGIYRVGGTGASILIRRRALHRGLNYTAVPSVTWLGEDRAFQLRAAVLGITLYLDSHYPAHHVYRLEELPTVDSLYHPWDGIPSARSACFRRADCWMTALNAAWRNSPAWNRCRMRGIRRQCGTGIPEGLVDSNAYSVSGRPPADRLRHGTSVRRTRARGPLHAPKQRRWSSGFSRSASA